MLGKERSDSVAGKQDAYGRKGVLVGGHVGWFKLLKLPAYLFDE